MSGWMELEQQLQTVSVPLSSVHTLSSAQRNSVHTLSSAQLEGSNSTVYAKAVLLERTPVQLNATGAAPVQGCVSGMEGGDKQGVPG